MSVHEPAMQALKSLKRLGRVSMLLLAIAGGVSVAFFDSSRSWAQPCPVTDPNCQR